MKILYDETGSIIVKISIVIRALYAAPMPSVVIYDRCITVISHELHKREVSFLMLRHPMGYLKDSLYLAIGCFR